MSYVRRIQITNYRSIRGLDIDLSPGPGQKFRHLILTGPNGSGKTSALELIHDALPNFDREGGSSVCKIDRPAHRRGCTSTSSTIKPTAAPPAAPSGPPGRPRCATHLFDR